MPRRGPYALQEVGPAGPSSPFWWVRRSPDWSTFTIVEAVDGTDPAYLSAGDVLAGPINLPAPFTDFRRPQVIQLTRTSTPNALCFTWPDGLASTGGFGAKPAWVWDWEAGVLHGPVEFTLPGIADAAWVTGSAQLGGALWWIDRNAGIVGQDDSTINAWTAAPDLSGFRKFGGSVNPDIPFVIARFPSNIWTVGSYIVAPLRQVTNIGPSNQEATAAWDTLSEGSGPVRSTLTRISLGNPNTGDFFDAPGVALNGSHWVTHNSRPIGSGGPWTLPGFVTAAGLGSITLTWAGWSRTNAERLRVTIDPGTGLALSSLSESNVADLWSPVTGISEPGWPRLLDLPPGSDRWHLHPRL